MIWRDQRDASISSLHQPVYVAGPMSGIEDLNVPLFKVVKAALEAKGVVVTSPHMVEASNWLTAMQNDLKLLTWCRSILLLPGWPSSKGACMELNVAIGLGYPVYFWQADGTIISMQRDGDVHP